jgi:uncharacterized protein
VVAVMANRADAMVFVGGKPVPMFKNLEKLTNTADSQMGSLLQEVHFLALNQPELKTDYEPATITKSDYNFVSADIPTMAVRSVLVTYDFSQSKNSYYTARCEQLGKLGKALRDNINQLQQNGHAKWKNVNLDMDLALWQRDNCAWPNAKPAVAQPATVQTSPLEKELLSIITGGKKTP